MFDGNIEAIEMLWTAIGVIGAAFASLNIVNAQRTINRLKKIAGDNVDAMVFARSARTVELVRVVMQAIGIAIGITAMTLPPSDLSELPTRYHISALILRWGIFSYAVGSLIQSLNSFRLRRYFKK